MVNVVQSGDLNMTETMQEDASDNVPLLAQEDNGNAAFVLQRDDMVLSSTAAILRHGNGNSILLIRDGNGSQAHPTRQSRKLWEKVQ